MWGWFCRSQQKAVQQTLGFHGGLFWQIKLCLSVVWTRRTLFPFQGLQNVLDFKMCVRIYRTIDSMKDWR